MGIGRVQSDTVELHGIRSFITRTTGLTCDDAVVPTSHTVEWVFTGLEKGFTQMKQLRGNVVWKFGLLVRSALVDP